jgi:rare lipoprotein A
MAHTIINVVAVVAAGVLLSSIPARARLVVTSWYGPTGNRTASGEIYNPRAFTAASRTLPLGTIVMLCEPHTNKCHDVRINDRGPFVRGRELDVTPAVARFLGFMRRGVARVEALGG